MSGELPTGGDSTIASPDASEFPVIVEPKSGIEAVQAQQRALLVAVGEQALAGMQRANEKRAAALAERVDASPRRLAT